MFTLFTLPDHPNSPSIFSGVGVAQSIVYCQVFGTSLLAHFLLGHFIFCSIYDFWSPFFVSSNCSYCCQHHDFVMKLRLILWLFMFLIQYIFIIEILWQKFPKILDSLQCTSKERFLRDHINNIFISYT